MAPVEATAKTVRGCYTADATAKDDNGLRLTVQLASH
jgi:hypothetical protein